MTAEEDLGIFILLNDQQSVDPLNCLAKVYSFSTGKKENLKVVIILNIIDQIAF